MPDTGAPWNIPYVASTDLVSDWPTDSQDLADAIADGLDAANVGIGTNVVSATTTTNTSTTSNSYVDTSLTASITPTSSSSKVLVIVSGTHENNANNATSYLAIFRGDSTGTQLVEFAALRKGDANTLQANSAGSYLDSPATTSAVTYTVCIKTLNSVATEFLPSSSGAAIITLIEVAA